MKIYRKLVIGFCFALSANCIGQKVINGKEYNTIYTLPEYQKSVSTKKGKMDPDAHADLIKQLEMLLDTVVSKKRVIIINFDQDAKNCIPLGYDYCRLTKTKVKLYNQTAEKYDALNIFVSADNSLFKDCFPPDNKNYIDNGFLKNSIFNDCNNCEALFILKPTGEYLKYFGGDYADKIGKFLKK